MIEAEKEKVFLALPTYDGTLHNGAAMGAFLTATDKRTTIVSIGQTSALCCNFNATLCVALTTRKEQGFKWFAMLHADIIPEQYWLDKLIDEGEANDADIISAVVPIKDGRGVTSTAIENPADEWSPYCRLTQRQVRYEDFPDTFDAHAARWALGNLPGDLRVDTPVGAQLLVNTGCMAMRLDRPWSESLQFETRDRILRTTDGWQAQFQPEDWLISRAICAAGGRVMATRKVNCTHIGGHGYRSQDIWGQATDVDCIREANEAARPELVIA